MAILVGMVGTGNLMANNEHMLSMSQPDQSFPLNEELARQGVDLRLGRSVASFTREEGGLVAHLDNGDSIPCGLAILSVGVRPETSLVKQAGLAMGKTGGIQVDDQMRTSASHVFAVGDAVESKDFVSQEPALIPLAGPANRQGRIAAEVILGRDSHYKATQGTSICKVFNLSFAMTGLSEATLLRKGLPFRSIYVHPADHATYYLRNLSGGFRRYAMWKESHFQPLACEPAMQHEDGTS